MKLITVILSFIFKHLLILHQNGTFLAKSKSALLLSLSVSPFAYVAEKIMNWGMENQDYILFVLGAITIDHILGSCVHAFIKRDFTWKNNIIGIGVKVGLAVAMGFLFEGVNHIIKEASFVKAYLIIVLRLAVFLYPAGSAAVNSAIITNGKFPPIGFLNKIKKFNENLDLSQFKEKKNHEK